MKSLLLLLLVGTLLLFLYDLYTRMTSTNPEDEDVIELLPIAIIIFLIFLFL